MCVVKLDFLFSEETMSQLNNLIPQFNNIFMNTKHIVRNIPLFIQVIIST